MIRHTILKPLIAAILLLTAFSCESESDASDIFISVPIEYYDKDVNGGENIFYPIEISSNRDILSRVEITTTDSVDGTVTVYEDDQLDARSISFEYPFTAPTYSQQSEVSMTLRIKAVDQSGYTGSLAVSITISSTVEADDVELTDISSVSLYGAASGKENGYSFSLSKFIISDSSDASKVDFYDYCEDLSNSESLSLEWRSMTGLYFGRLTGFDYSSATLNKVLAGYALCSKLDQIRDIQDEDIIFIGYDEQTPLAVIKVNAVIDLDGTSDDRYIISMKRTYLEEGIEGWGEEPVEPPTEDEDEEEDEESIENTDI